MGVLEPGDSQAAAWASDKKSEGRTTRSSVTGVVGLDGRTQPAAQPMAGMRQLLRIRRGDVSTVRRAPRELDVCTP